MIKNCQLFENGGNYDEREVEWYRNQMSEINDMVDKSKVDRQDKVKELIAEMEKLMKEPYQQFEKDYKASIDGLSAKEGLGKTFGQPRRICQEKLRSEMTKCEEAQKGVSKLFDELERLC